MRIKLLPLSDLEINRLLSEIQKDSIVINNSFKMNNDAKVKPKTPTRETLIYILGYPKRLRGLSSEYLKDKYLVIKGDTRRDPNEGISFKIVSRASQYLFKTSNGITYDSSETIATLYPKHDYQSFKYLENIAVNYAIPLSELYREESDNFYLTSSYLESKIANHVSEYSQKPVSILNDSLHRPLSKKPEKWKADDRLFVLCQETDFSWKVNPYRSVDVLPSMYKAGVVFAKKEYAESFIKFLTNTLLLKEDKTND